MACKYGTWSRGQDEALLNILGGQEVAERIIARKVRVTIEEAEEKKNPILRLITSGLTLPATTGERLLSKQKALFPGWIDPDLSNYGCNVAGEARPETLVDVNELTEDATYEQIFEGQGVGLDKLCLTQDQIASFVENHRGHLHPEGWTTFFLFKVSMEKAEGEMKVQFFLANVNWNGAARKLRVSVRRLSCDDVWNASYRLRVVLPRLAL